MLFCEALRGCFNPLLVRQESGLAVNSLHWNWHQKLGLTCTLPSARVPTESPSGVQSFHRSNGSPVDRRLLAVNRATHATRLGSSMFLQRIPGCLVRFHVGLPEVSNSAVVASVDLRESTESRRVARQSKLPVEACFAVHSAMYIYAL